jgi:hypothetical protein
MLSAGAGSSIFAYVFSAFAFISSSSFSSRSSFTASTGFILCRSTKNLLLAIFF